MAFNSRRGYIPGQPRPGMRPAGDEDEGPQSQRRSPSFGEPGQGVFGGATRRQPAMGGEGGGGMDGRQAGPPSRAVSPMEPAVRPEAPVPPPDPIAPTEAATPTLGIGGDGLGGNPMDAGMGGVNIEQMLQQLNAPQGPPKRRV